MKVYVNNQLHDSNEETVVLVFTNDIDRLKFIDILSKMIPNPDATRIYAAFPDGTDIEKVKVIIEEAKAAHNG